MRSTVKVKKKIMPTPEVSADQSPLLTSSEAAAFLRMSQRQLERLVADKAIPHVRITQRCLRFYRRELAAWLKSKHVPQNENGQQ